ncbi:hypothetical protein G6F50_014177 [Rhizopus delemar]|uniref:Uncharacterized protein n=1 Tax=Rhizopus delemar TaxID=936053 RepID=A0A9P7C992_9FUNG|nr:hypothetical protein G6F50_014177 [Rhizopus delemar]
MTDQNNAAQAAEQDIEAIMEQAQVFASAWAFLGGPFDNGSGLEQAERERSNLRALLSKLRAEGVQAGEPTAFEAWAKGVGGDFARHNCGPYDRDAMKLAGMAWRAALASAPVAGEAHNSNSRYAMKSGTCDAAPQASDVVRDAARWRSFRAAITQQDVGWLERMDTALTAMGCDLDDEAPPSADQVDAAADAASAALSPPPPADKLARN